MLDINTYMITYDAAQDPISPLVTLIIDMHIHTIVDLDAIVTELSKILSHLNQDER